jgi:hypothetical protein
MKRIVAFAGLLALLGGLVLVPCLTDDAQAQSRIKIRPFTTPYAATVRATAATNVLATPSSSVRGFIVTTLADSALGAVTVVVTIYHESGDSTALTIYPAEIAVGGGPLQIPFPNVRVTGFRVAVTNGTVTAPAYVYINGWY